MSTHVFRAKGFKVNSAYFATKYFTRRFRNVVNRLKEINATNAIRSQLNDGRTPINKIWQGGVVQGKKLYFKYEFFNENQKKMECSIHGIPVKFPFEPYDIQKDYMAKVIECLQNDSHGVLESPTGTGKTLSLLCSSLAWLEVKKAQIQALWHKAAIAEQKEESKENVNDMFTQLNSLGGGSKNRGSIGMAMPQIIYSSRTHSQLSQAMQELKRTSYNYMKASVLGSREQMCIHPEIVKEELNSVKINMCRVKVQSRTCHFYNRVERQKDNPVISEQKVIDIEDLVKLGETHKFCPYYMSKELKQKADIIFMPYNYLLDPRARKALGVELSNNIIILDEAHNVEKMCEESASLQIKTADIALCIEEVTEVMKAISNDHSQLDFTDTPPDFTADELCILKQMFLDFEKVLDSVEIKNKTEGQTFEGNYIFEMFSGAGIRDENQHTVIATIERISQFLGTVNSGPFQRKGHALQLFEDMLRIAFASTKPEFKEKIKKCYKVHIIVEQPPSQKQSNNWLSKMTAKTGKVGRVLSYWCFSPGFGMNMLMGQGVKCVILTSGTLAPLKPLITELEMNINIELENPHIVKGDQVCVKILSKGPDGHLLNCNYQNRNNPAYIKSLGMTINNLAKFIPDGLLIFFPSYPLMRMCKDSWQEEGLWSTIYENKNIFVEPKEKNAFNESMTNYYQTVIDPNKNGAIFMGVCRGKVSEGLDFADANGRAVIVIGLPYPPFKDPRIILKKRYLDACRAKNNQYLCGNDWYSLEATKAVNQAIGRVIRHRNDYGAIILLDSRFNNPKVISQMSMWLRKYVKNVNNYGELIRELKTFYKDARDKYPVTARKPINRIQQSQNVAASFSIPQAYKKTPGMFDFSSSSSCSSLSMSSSDSSTSGLVTIHKRGGEVIGSQAKRKRINIVPNQPASNDAVTITNVKEYLLMVKKCLNPEEYKSFVGAIKQYRDSYNFDELCKALDGIFLLKMNLSYIILGLQPYVKTEHKSLFETYCNRMSL